MPNLFISYARQDTDSARSLVKALREKNIVGWLDNADIASGEAVSSAVRDALKRSSVVIVLLSKNALQSQWVQFEIGAAEALEKKIIPIILSSDVSQDELPDILRHRSWIDGRDRPLEDVARDVKRAVEPFQEQQ
jgi:hypothetical protein